MIKKPNKQTPNHWNIAETNLIVVSCILFGYCSLDKDNFLAECFFIKVFGF